MNARLPFTELLFMEVFVIVLKGRQTKEEEERVQAKKKKWFLCTETKNGSGQRTTKHLDFY